jgi:hypothetical protein
MTKKQQERRDRLLPNGIPRWVRCYDNEGRSFDRYTVVYTGRYKKDPGIFHYVGMSKYPYHPQGFGQHGETQHKPCDVTGNSWAGPSIGKKCHLGTRIKFEDLPDDCKDLVMRDYRDFWELEA